MKLITKEQFKVMLWKNGAGTTTELYRVPHDNDFFIRISIANVESDGPFSIFSGVQRHLMILSGNGIDLKFKDSSVSLTTDSPVYSFSGEENIYCTLKNGKVTDFNVMINASFGTAVVNKNSYGESFDELFIYDLRLQTLSIYRKNEKINAPESYISVEIKKAG